MRARMGIAVAVGMVGALAAGVASASACAPGVAQEAFAAHPAGGPALVARLDTLTRSCPGTVAEVAALAAAGGPRVQAAAGAGLARAAAAFWGTDRGPALAAEVAALPVDTFSGAFFAVLGALTGLGAEVRPAAQAGNPLFGGGNGPCRPGNSWHDRDRCTVSPR